MDVTVLVATHPPRLLCKQVHQCKLHAPPWLSRCPRTPLAARAQQQQQQQGTAPPSTSVGEAVEASEEVEASDEEDEDGDPPVLVSVKLSYSPDGLLLFLYRTAVRMVVYCTAIVLGMGSSSIMQVWLRAAVFMNVAMGLCIRDTWGLWEKYNKPKRIAPHVAMLDACTVLFVGANALAVGLISARVLEVIGNALGFWLLCSLHFDQDAWPFDQRRAKPQQPRSPPDPPLGGPLTLDRREQWMVATAVLCAGISMWLVCHVFDVYTTALANEEVLSRMARSVAAALKR